MCGFDEADESGGGVEVRDDAIPVVLDTFDEFVVVDGEDAEKEEGVVVHELVGFVFGGDS